jgi:outer membrane protein OmpA-like peptidoglycan-associated protein
MTFLEVATPVWQPTELEAPDSGPFQRLFQTSFDGDRQEAATLENPSELESTTEAEFTSETMELQYSSLDEVLGGETTELNEYAGETAGGFEYDSPPTTQQRPAPKIATNFSRAALALLPSAFEAKGLARLEVAVPTKNIWWLVDLAKKGTRKHWTKQMAVSWAEFIQLVPQVKVHVDLFKVRPLDPVQPVVMTSFEAYAQKASPSRINLFAHATLSFKPQLEKLLDERLGDLLVKGGLPPNINTTTTPDQRAEHFLVIYAEIPPGMSRLLEDERHRVIDNFVFDRSELTAHHKEVLDATARYIHDSWQTHRKVKWLHIEGHTDKIGTREYNLGLGLRRADAAAAYLKDALRKLSVDPAVLGWETVSRGAEEPVAKEHPLNRRVEISLGVVDDPPTNALKIEDVISRLQTLLTNQRVMDPDQSERLLCVLGKLRQGNADDRYASSAVVFYALFRDRTRPSPGHWPTFRLQLIDPLRFGPLLTDTAVLKNLVAIEDDLIGGAGELQRLIDYYAVIDDLVGQTISTKGMSTAGILGPQITWWKGELLKRVTDDNKKSVYACYRKLFGF